MFVGILMFGTSHNVNGQDNYFFSNIDINTGLAHNNVFEIYQDSKGFFWFGAGTKLQRFDGKKFVTFEHQINNPNTIAFGDIRTILEDFSGDLWVGTDGGGVSRLKDGKFSTFKNNGPGSLSNNSVEQIIQTPDSVLYMGTWGGGISVLKEGVFSEIRYDASDEHSIPNDKAVALLYDEETKILWVGTWGGGLCYIKDNRVYRIPINESGFNSTNARAIAKTSDGAIWIGSWGSGLFRYKDGKFKQFSEQDKSLASNNVLSLKADGNVLWIGTWGGGVSRYEDGVFETFRSDPKRKNSLVSDFIESTLLDRRGNLIVGTFGGGISKFEKSQFRHVDDFALSEDIDNSPSISSIIEDKDHKIWIGGTSGMYISNGTSFENLRAAYPQIPDIKPVYSLFKTRDDDIWMGGSTRVGLYQFDGKRFMDRSQAPNVDFKNYFIHDISESYDGSLWISADVDAGLIHIQKDTILRYFHDPEDDNSIVSNHLYVTLTAADSTLWVCTSRSGLTTFKNGKFKRYVADDADSKSLSNNYIYCILKASDQTIWIGTEQGLNKYNPAIDGFESFFTEDGLLDNTVRSILEDDSGNIWMGTHRGVSRLDPKTMSFQNFDNRSGIAAHPFNRRAIHQSSITGEIYLGGINGLTVFHPDTIKSHLPVPEVQISNILINNQSVIFGNDSLLNQPLTDAPELDLKRFDGSIAFDYSDMNFGAGEEVQYSYRIRNVESVWNFVGNNITAIYSNLSPGDYLFEVRASIDGINWDATDFIEFHISPYWWETWWFRLIVAALVMGIIVGFILTRFRFLERQKEKLKVLVDEKTTEVRQKSTELIRSNTSLKHALIELKNLEDQRIAFQENEREAISRELHDSISTTLFGIRLLINQGLEKIKKKESSGDVSNMVDELLGGVIKDSNIILNSLSTYNTKHVSFYDSLSDIIERSRKLSNIEIEWEWNGHHHVDELEMASNLFRIIREALENALRHSESEHIAIYFDNSDIISFHLKDDGKGFDTDLMRPADGGIERMHRRAREIGATLIIDSSRENGTCISLKAQKKECSDT